MLEDFGSTDESLPEREFASVCLDRDGDRLYIHYMAGHLPSLTVYPKTAYRLEETNEGWTLYLAGEPETSENHTQYPDWTPQKYISRYLRNWRITRWDFQKYTTPVIQRNLPVLSIFPEEGGSEIRLGSQPEPTHPLALKILKGEKVWVKLRHLAVRGLLEDQGPNKGINPCRIWQDEDLMFFAFQTDLGEAALWAHNKNRMMFEEVGDTLVLARLSEPEVLVWYRHEVNEPYETYFNRFLTAWQIGVKEWKENTSPKKNLPQVELL